MADPAPKPNPIERAGASLRSMTSTARWAAAIVVGSVLIGAVLLCTVPGLVMATFATDACGTLPNWMDAFLFAPGALAIAGILIAALLFGTRRRIRWVLAALLAGGLLCALTYFAWYALIAVQC